MKHYPESRAVSRVPAFHPVPARLRHDGWTPQRQAAFLGYLAITRSVSAAARLVGMSREGAYRLRRQPEAGSFAAAWDAALGLAGPKAKVTLPALLIRLEQGLLRPIVQRGKLLGIARKTDAAARRALIARIDRIAARARAAGPEGHNTKTARDV